MKRKAVLIAALLAAAVPFASHMAGAEGILDDYLAAARKKDPGVNLSAAEGKQFFNAKRRHSAKGEERSCSLCHTADPTRPGKTPVGKVIEPMAHSKNRDRFTDPKKVEKWFKRNCEYVLERECTPLEKGNFIAYMRSI